MKIVLIGYGAMGRIVERLALEAGHEVAVAPSSDGTERKFDALVDALRGHDAAIDFSVAGAVPTNVKACIDALWKMPAGRWYMALTFQLE